MILRSYEELMKMERHEALYILNYRRGNTNYKVATVSGPYLVKLKECVDEWAKENYSGDDLKQLLLSHEAARDVILKTNS